MVLDLLDLDDLLALPAGREHRTLAPVVHVQGILVPGRVGPLAELADKLVRTRKLGFVAKLVADRRSVVFWR